MRRTAALVGLGAVAASVVASRRWAADADDGLLDLPPGQDRVVVAPDRGRLSVRVAGTGGTTYVLPHGWTGDRRVWAPVARRLVAAGQTVVLYDHRDHGGSIAGSDGLTIEALAADLRAVLETLDVRGAVLAGHSIGGMTAQAFAVAYPEVLRERVAALALVSTGCDRLRFGILGTLPSVRFAGDAIGKRSLGSPVLGPVLARATVGREVRGAYLDVVRESFCATTVAARIGLLGAMARLDLSEGVRGLDLPVLVVAGSRDLLTPLPHSRRLARLVPGARLEVVRGVGHMLPLEAPDRLADLLLEHARSAR